MGEYEKQLKIVQLLEQAIFNIKFAAQEEQKLTHKPHFDVPYRQILEILDLKRTYEESKLKRLEILG